MLAAGGDEAKYLAPFRDYVAKIGQSSATIANGIYTVMDRDGKSDLEPRYLYWVMTSTKAGLPLLTTSRAC